MMWDQTFLQLFEKCSKKYESGNRDFHSYYSATDLAFLASIGYQPREFFDFVEDYHDAGEPSASTALLIASVRRDYFLVVQKGKFSTVEKLNHHNIPSFGEELGGIHYLPRILAKAKAKLRGELDPDVMFGCGGDRAFLSRNGEMHPADFLRHVWAADDDDQKIVAVIKTHSK